MARRLSYVVEGVFLVVLLVLAPRIASVFTDATAVAGVTARYLRVVAIAYALQGIYLVSVSTLNALRRPLHAAGLAAIEMLVFIAPLTWLGSRLFGITGAFAAIAVSYAATGLISISVVRCSVARAESAAGR